VAMATASRQTCRGRDRMRPPKFRSNRSIDRRVMAFPIFPTWRPSAIWNWTFLVLGHSRSQPCGPINVSKFGVDLIIAARDIAIL